MYHQLSFRGYSEIPEATPKPPYVKESVMEEKTEWNETVELTNEH